MRFICEKAALSEAVNSVSPAVSAKSTLAALECILLTVKGETLTVIGYNTELGITKTVEVEAVENGEVILNARLFSEIINKMPAGPVTLTVDEKMLTVITGGNAASIHLHEKFGFVHCGTLREVGFKHGAYRDIDHFLLEV